MGNIVDISRWNYPVDFNALADAGVDGVIIKAGSGNKIDTHFLDYANEAVKHGFDIGFYWFIYIHSGRTISENAVCFENAVRDFKNKITLKVWCDFEYHTEEQVRDNDGHTFDMETRTKLILDFMNTMRFYGYDCGYYANRDYMQYKLNRKKLEGYPLWYARYTFVKDEFTKKAFLWQYTNKLNIGGKIFDDNKLMQAVNKFYPRINVTTAFKAADVPYDFESRKKIAQVNGIKDFVGSVEQNAELIKLLADGKLKNPF